MGAKYLDKDTGEVSEEPDFVKVYIRHLCKVKDLNSNQSKMFNFMLSNMNYNNIVSYGSSSKKEFLDEINMKPQTFNNNVSKLISSGLIVRISKGEFLVNKKYAVKVDWTRVQSIRWIADYSKDGVSEKVIIDESGDVIIGEDE